MAGSLNSAAALCDHRPDLASGVRLAITVGLDDGGRALLLELAGAVEADRFERVEEEL